MAGCPDVAWWSKWHLGAEALWHSCILMRSWYDDTPTSVFQAMGISTVGKAWDCKHKKWALQTVLGSRVQSLLEVTFLLNLFCSNTILADLTEWCIYGKILLNWILNLQMKGFFYFLLILYSAFQTKSFKTTNQWRKISNAFTWTKQTVSSHTVNVSQYNSYCDILANKFLVLERIAYCQVPIA